MKASGNRPCAASQLALDEAGSAVAAGRMEAGSHMSEHGEPTAIGLFFAIRAEAALFRFAEEMARFSIRLGA
jgi:hypothetical protein